MVLTLERPEIRAELNHSCIPGQCSVPCPYTSELTGLPVLARIPRQPGPSSSPSPKIPQQPGPKEREQPRPSVPRQPGPSSR